jgi:hypothetical protein
MRIVTKRNGFIRFKHFTARSTQLMCPFRHGIQTAHTDTSNGYDRRVSRARDRMRRLLTGMTTEELAGTLRDHTRLLVRGFFATTSRKVTPANGPCHIMNVNGKHVTGSGQQRYLSRLHFTHTKILKCPTSPGGSFACSTLVNHTLGRFHDIDHHTRALTGWQNISKHDMDGEWFRVPETVQNPSNNAANAGTNC